MRAILLVSAFVALLPVSISGAAVPVAAVQVPYGNATESGTQQPSYILERLANLFPLFRLQAPKTSPSVQSRRRLQRPHDPLRVASLL